MKTIIKRFVIMMIVITSSIGIASAQKIDVQAIKTNKSINVTDLSGSMIKMGLGMEFNKDTAKMQEAFKGVERMLVLEPEGDSGSSAIMSAIGVLLDVKDPMVNTLIDHIDKEDNTRVRIMSYSMKKKDMKSSLSIVVSRGEKVENCVIFLGKFRDKDLMKLAEIAQ